MRKATIILLVVLLGVAVLVPLRSVASTAVHTQEQEGFQLEWTQPTLQGAYGLAIFYDGGWYIVAVNGTYITLYNARGVKIAGLDVEQWATQVLGFSDTDKLGLAYPSTWRRGVIVSATILVYFEGTTNGYDFYVAMVNATADGVLVEWYRGAGSDSETLWSAGIDPRLRATHSVEPTAWIYPTQYVSLGNLSELALFGARMPTKYVAVSRSNVLIDASNGGAIEGSGFSIPATVAVADLDASLPGSELVGLYNASPDFYLFADAVLNVSGSPSYGDNYAFENLTQISAIPSFGEMVDVVVGDFDVDGTNEVAVDYAGAIRVFSADLSSGAFTSEANVSVVGYTDRLVAVNYTASPSLEFVYVNTTHIVVQALNGQIMQAVPYSGDVIADLVPSDLNDDGLIDIAVLTNTTMYFLYANTSDSYTLPVQPASSNLVLGDIDLDGNLEALYVSGDTLVCVQTPYHSVANTQLSSPTNDRTYTGFTDDIDGDGLSDSQEVSLGTNAYNPDTDSDGLLDGAEVNQYHTDPLNPDTDGDGYSDGYEVANGMNPLSPNIPGGGGSTQGPPPYSGSGDDWSVVAVVAIAVMVGGAVAYARQAGRRRKRR